MFFLRNYYFQDFLNFLFRARYILYVKFTNLSLSNLYRLMRSVTRKLAIDLYKISKFKDALEGPFCAEESGFNFDFSILNKRDIYVRVGEVDMSLINSDRADNFDQLKKQAEAAFKKVETKDELSLYLSQFFNLQEDINDCFNLAKQQAC